MEPWLQENPTFSFQQDNAAVHGSKETKAWLAAHKIPHISWPARSPDLNPIEHVWTWMKSHLYEARGPNTERLVGLQLKAAILEAWEAVPEAFLQSLLASMPNRIADVIRMEGGDDQV